MEAKNRVSAKAGRDEERAQDSGQLECEIEVSGRHLEWLATCVIRWAGLTPQASSGEEVYSRAGKSAMEAVERVRDAALSDQRGESRRWIEMASSLVLRELAQGVAPKSDDLPARVGRQVRR